MTVKAKAIVNTFYGNAPTRSYFNGCSTGGRQALIEATRFPDDFDGIIAGAAANPKTHLDTWRIWMGLETMKDPATRIPQEKYPAIHQAVLAACDALDGLKDGLIDDPTRCHFDAHVLACKGRRWTGLPDARRRCNPSTRSSDRRKSPRTGDGDLSGLPAGHRAAVGSADRWTRSLRHRPRSVQVHRVQRSEVGLADVRRRSRSGEGRRVAQGPADRDRSEEHQRVRRTRRQAPDVSRLERSGHLRRSRA